MLLVFLRSPIDGSLTFVQKIEEGVEFSGLRQVQDVAIGNTDDRVYVASRQDYQVVVFDREPASDLLRLRERVNKGPLPEGLWHPSIIETSQDDEDLIVLSGFWPNFTGDITSRHYESSRIQWLFEYEGLGHLRDLKLTPDDRQALMTLQSSFTGPRHHVAVLDHHDACGELKLREVYSDGIGSITGLSNPTDIVISADKRHVYVVASDLVVFAIDSDRDGIPNNLSPSTVLPTTTECLPTSDSDGDGYPNDQDHFPNDSTEHADSDGDGQGDNADQDDDNDGVMDAVDNCRVHANAGQQDADGDGRGDSCDPDDDNDGVVDSADAFPRDPTEREDFDRDGIGDNADTDDDGDGMSDDAEVAAGRNPKLNEPLIYFLIRSRSVEPQ